jgi:hypothetical protein
VLAHVKSCMVHKECRVVLIISTVAQQIANSGALVKRGGVVAVAAKL